MAFEHIDEEILYQIVVSESSKSFFRKEADQENKDGYFEIYKRISHRIAMMIKEASPDYAYPESLASTMMEASLHQNYFKAHFPTLTNCKEGVSTTEFIIHLVTKTLN